MNKRNLTAFKLEKQRQELASKGKFKELRKTYKKGLPEIKDLNSGSFWDDKIDEDTEHKPQDGMTNERIKIAYQFMPKTTKKILDIGAGYGYIERLISKNKNIKIYGNDVSRNAIVNLNKRFKGKFKLESIYSMKYTNNSFDVVFALEVFEHVPPSKILHLMKKTKKILRKNGYLIISIPTNEGLDKMKENPNGHVRMYTKDLIKAELSLAGFKVMEVKTLSAFKNLYLLKKILSKILKNKWKPNDIIVKAKSI